MAKRYILFGFDTYYPAGGAHDIIKTGNDLNELWGIAMRREGFRNFNIYDMELEDVVRDTDDLAD